jgi:hypothetical protein
VNRSVYEYSHDLSTATVPLAFRFSSFVPVNTVIAYSLLSLPRIPIIGNLSTTLNTTVSEGNIRTLIRFFSIILFVLFSFILSFTHIFVLHPPFRQAKSFSGILWIVPIALVQITTIEMPLLQSKALTENSAPEYQLINKPNGTCSKLTDDKN